MRCIWFSKYCTHLDAGDEEIDAAIDVATRITAGTLER
jgi:hypothetical protein